MDEGIACIGGKIMISEAVIKRLPRYYRHIKHLADSGVTRVSSNKIANVLNITGIRYDNRRRRQYRQSLGGI